LNSPAYSPAYSSTASLDSAPLHLFHYLRTNRTALGFLLLTCTLMLMGLLLYAPQRQEGLLCGSAVARGARLRYANAIQGRSLSDMQRIQQQQGGAFIPSAPSTVTQYSPFATSPLPAIPPPSTAPGGVYLPIPPARTPQYWERRSFTAARPASIPDLPPVEDMQGKYAEWEAELKQLLEVNGNDVPTAFRAFLSPLLDPLEIRPASFQTVDQAVVLLDARQDAHMIFTLRHTMHLLGPGWGLIIFHTEANESWLIDQLKIRPGEPGEFIQLQRVEPIGTAQASSLVLSSVFYDRIGVETILLLQPDTLMLRSPFLGRPADLAHWDSLLAAYGYLGAPWAWCKEEWCLYGGGGGVSVRKASMMREVIAELRCSSESAQCERFDLFREQETNPDEQWKAEDTFLAHRIHAQRSRFTGRLANQVESSQFAQETDLAGARGDPFFLQKAWMFQKQEKYLPMIARVKEVYTRGK
jgi:hypothetical protein